MLGLIVTEQSIIFFRAIVLRNGNLNISLTKPDMCLVFVDVLVIQII